MSSDFWNEFRCEPEALVPGFMYLRFCGGREDPRTPMEQWEDDEPIFGPLSSFKIYDADSCGVGFADGSCYLIIERGSALHVCQGLIWYSNLYHSPEVFLSK